MIIGNLKFEIYFEVLYPFLVADTITWISQISFWVLVTEALLNLNTQIQLKAQNNQRNKLFERAWPLRLVAPLPTPAQVSFIGKKIAWV